MMSEVSVVLISSSVDIDKILGKLRQKKIDIDATLFVALDEGARKSIALSNLNGRSIDDYYVVDEGYLRKHAYRLAKEWFLVSGFDGTLFEGVSLGETLQIEVGHFLFYETGRMIAQVREIIAQHTPSRWLLAMPDAKLWFSVIRTISPDSSVITARSGFLEPLRELSSSRRLKLWLRREGYDQQLRHLAFAFRRLASVGRKADPTIHSNTVLFLVDTPVSSVIDTLVPVIRQTPADRCLVVAADPRCQQKLQEVGINSTPFSVSDSIFSLPRIERGLKRQLHRHWEALSKSRDAEPLLLDGVDLWLICKDILEKLFHRRLPSASLHYKRVQDIYARHDVKAVAMVSDKHYFGQIFAKASGRAGIYSLVIQHGMVNSPEGYLPVETTQMAVMGPAVRDWCLMHGATSEQIVVTGQPRFDYLSQPPETSSPDVLAALQLDPERATLLFAPEPQLGLWMRDLMFSGLLALPDVQAIIRIHPNDDLSHYQTSLLQYPELQERVRITRRFDVASILGACDTVVIGRSTLGLEALIAGCSILIVQPPAQRGWITPPYVDEYVRDLPQLICTDTETLVQAWRILHNTEFQAVYARVRDQIVRAYAVDDKGGSAVRASQVLCKSQRT